MDDLMMFACTFLVCGGVAIASVLTLISWFAKPKAAAALEHRIDTLEAKLNWTVTELAQTKTQLASLQALARTPQIAPVAQPSVAERWGPSAQPALMQETGPIDEVVENAPVSESANPPAEEPSPEVTPSSVTDERWRPGAQLASVPVLETPALYEVVAEDASATDASNVAAYVAAPVSDASVASPSDSDAASAPTFAPAPPPPRPPRDDSASAAAPASQNESWEQWIGVRGAAAAGAIVLVIAGLYFFKYSMDHGLIGPTMRVILATLTGLTCIATSERPLRKHNPVLSNWLAGAGIAILYTSFWAMSGLYALVPGFVSFVLMVGVTGLCVALSIRRSSLAIAVLGLLGGFVTPLALSTGQDRPIELFTYILLLDGALLWVAYKRGWRSLAAFALFATVFYEMGWVFGSMSEGKLLIGGVIIVVFSLLFALVPARPGEGERTTTSLDPLQIGAALFPFVLALSFAGRSSVASLHMTLVLMLVLVAGASFLSVARKAPILSLGAASASLGLLVVSAITHSFTAATAWEFTAAVAMIGAILQLAGERAEDANARWASSLFALVAVLILGAEAARSQAIAPWPFLVGISVLTTITLRNARTPDYEWLHAIAATALAGALATITLSTPGDLSAGIHLGIAVLAAVSFQVSSFVTRSTVARWWSDVGSVVVALVVLLSLAVLPEAARAQPWWMLAAALLLALLSLFAAARSGIGEAVFLTTFMLALVNTTWTFGWEHRDLLALDYAALVVSVLGLTLWPAVGGAGVRNSAWTWRAAALAGPLHFAAMRLVHIRLFGTGTIGFLAIGLAVTAFAALMLARAYGPADAENRRTALAWLAVTVTAFVTAAIPLQLENEWVTIGWAVEGAVVIALFHRIDHAGLKYLAAALFAAVGVRLLLNPYVLQYYDRSPIRIFNWLSYTYLVPAVALVAGASMLRSIEVARLRPWEENLYPKRAEVLASGFFAGAILVVFAWLNLTIFDWFATGESLTIPTSRLAARDLSVSIVWALYALLLLALGMWRTSQALRVVSLLLLLLTLAKVFLYDLANLEDLYRVAALVGLALSLIVVSLAYQRFVFRNPSKEHA